MGTLGLGQRALNLLRGGADLGAALGANLATSAMEHQLWGAASACVAGTALFIAGRNALSAHGEQKTHAQIEKRLLRALQDGQTDLLTAIRTVAAEHDMHDFVSQRRVKRLAKLLTARADELAKATADTARILDAIGHKLDEQCHQHNQTLDSVTDELKRLAAQSHAEHQRHERRSRKDHRRLERKANAIERDVKELVKRVTPPPIQPLHQLRPPLKDFTGRQAEINELLTLIRHGSVAITGVQGMGGIGKTELAYVLADRVKDAYPNAQLVLELKGTSPSPLSPADVLAYIIHRFHPAEKLPDDVAELTKLYHSTLHGKRVLLLMDNAADAAQVAPLCPPPDGSVLLVTSRQHFTLPGLHVKNLDTLPMDKACDLLRTICPRLAAVASAPRGRRRALETPPLAAGLADELAQLCGCLPLALRVAASALAERATLTPADYIARLKDEQRRMKELDPVMASLALSDALLPNDLRQRWYALAVFPGDFDVAAAAAVWDAKPDDAQDALDALHRYSVLEWNEQTRRFRLHDLARLFVDQRLDDAHRTATRRRHAKHFERVLRSADDLYLQGAGAVTRGLALFDLEWANIQAGSASASAQAEHDEAAARLCSAYPDAGVYCLDLRQHPRDRIAWRKAALAAARRLKDREAEGVHLGNLGLAYAALGEPRRAIEFHEQCLKIAREIGDRRGEGTALGNLGNAYTALGEPRRAIEFYEQRLKIAREIGDRRGEGNDLGNLANAYADLGEPRRAIKLHEQALAISREIGDRRAEGQDLGNLGLAYAALGEPRRAIEFYEQRLRLAREIGDRQGEGHALGNLGLAYAALSEPRRAIEFHEHHLKIAREIGDRRGEGHALGNLGVAYANLAEPRRAIEFHEQHLNIAREVGDRRSEAIASWNLGLHYEKAGDLARAAELMQLCADYEREIAHADAEKHAAHVAALRARLK